jgi:hypothetical protein
VSAAMRQNPCSAGNAGAMRSPCVPLSRSLPPTATARQGCRHHHMGPACPMIRDARSRCARHNTADDRRRNRPTPSRSSVNDSALKDGACAWGQHPDTFRRHCVHTSLTDLTVGRLTDWLGHNGPLAADGTSHYAPATLRLTLPPRACFATTGTPEVSARGSTVAVSGGYSTPTVAHPPVVRQAGSALLVAAPRLRRSNSPPV